MDNRIYGYARVSTREQNEDRQVEAINHSVSCSIMSTSFQR